MEQSKALTSLIEAADLLQLVEDMLNPNLVDKLSPASISGLRITLRNAREAVVNSHNSIANRVIKEATALTESNVVEEGANANASQGSLNIEKTVETPKAEPGYAPNLGASSMIQLTRRDLRSTLERS